MSPGTLTWNRWVFGTMLFAVLLGLPTWGSCGEEGEYRREATVDTSPAVVEPMARFFPRENLGVFLEFDGLDAHADAWSQSAAHKILSETSTGAMLQSLLEQVLTLAGPGAAADSTAPPGASKELVESTAQLVKKGFALGIVRAPEETKPQLVGIVIRGGAEPPIRALAESIARRSMGSVAAIETIDRAGRSVSLVSGRGQQGIAWFSEGGDLALCLVRPRGFELMIDALDGRCPDARQHPTRLALAAKDGEFEPIGWGFFEMRAIPPLPDEAARLGLDRIERIDFRWGIAGQAIQTVTRLVAPAPRSGVLGLLDQPGFTRADLPRAPQGTGTYTAFSLDIGVTLDKIVAMEAASRAPKLFAEALADVATNTQENAGLDLRKELIDPLGSTHVLWTFETRGTRAAGPILGAIQGILHAPQGAWRLPVADSGVYRPRLERFVTELDKDLAPERAGLNPPGQTLPSLRLVPLKRDLGGWATAEPVNLFPLFLNLRPTLSLGDRALVLASTPDAASRALATETGQTQPAPWPQEIDPTARLMFLHANDPEEALWPDLLESLPGLLSLLRNNGAGLGNIVPFFAPQRGVAMLIGGGPNGPPIAIDPDLAPSSAEIRKYLFPSIYYAAVDDSGLRFVTREPFPTVNPVAFGPLALAGLVPLLQVRSVTLERSISVNNLKQILLAMHNFHDVHGHFPADIVDAQGKPLLSWRVQLLPFLEQSNAFQQFHLDEPWDSPHNRPLLEQMPSVYDVRSGVVAEPGHTFYRGFSGPHAVFDPEFTRAPNLGVLISSVTDGTSNTIAVVEAREAVPWTKPGTDIPFDGELNLQEGRELLPDLGGHFAGGFNAAFLDGSVRFIRETINSLTLRAIITRDGGEVVASDQF